MNNKARLQTIRDSVIATIADILDEHSSDTMDVTDLGSTPIVWPGSFSDDDTYTLDRVYASEKGGIFIDSSSSSDNRTDRIEDISTDVIVDILDFLEDNEEMIWRKNDPAEEPEKDILVCEICGSTNTQMKVWIDSNSHKFIAESNLEVVNRVDIWCKECNEHVYVVYKSEFEKKMDDWAREKGVVWIEGITYEQKRKTYNKLKQS